MAEEELDTSRLFQNIGLTTLCHPLTQTRYLIQLGYEPLSPVYKPATALSKKLMLASDCHVQPGLISLGGAQPSYVSAAGLLDSKNITRGLGMSICETIIASLGKTVATKPVTNAFPKKEQDDSFDQVMVDSIRESLINSTGIILANPFRVIAIRQVASIVDGTSKGILESIKEGGLFAGLIPRLAFEFGSIFIVRSAMHLYRQHAAELLSSGDDKKTKETSESVAQLAISHVTSMLLYPLKLVATCQAVQGTTGCSLDIFPELGWLAILSELRRQEESMRGNSVTFARKVKAPVIPPPAPVEIVVETPPVAPLVVEVPPVAVEVPIAPPVAEVAQPIAVEKSEPVEKSE